MTFHCDLPSLPAFSPFFPLVSRASLPHPHTHTHSPLMVQDAMALYETLLRDPLLARFLPSETPPATRPTHGPPAATPEPPPPPPGPGAPLLDAVVLGGAPPPPPVPVACPLRALTEPIEVWHTREPVWALAVDRAGTRSGAARAASPPQRNCRALALPLRRHVCMSRSA